MTNTTNTKEHTEQKEKLKETFFLEEINLRDYFAAQALPVIMPNNRSYPMDAAKAAYAFADAMMKAREL